MPLATDLNLSCCLLRESMSHFPGLIVTVLYINNRFNLPLKCAATSGGSASPVRLTITTAAKMIIEIYL